jgi:UDP-2-acetamido-3-amino-2,3-dideoxy-glucuronate N-acetyltransferase
MIWALWPRWCDAAESVEENYKRQYADVKFHRDFAAVLSDPSITAVALARPAVTHTKWQGRLWKPGRMSSWKSPSPSMSATARNSSVWRALTIEFSWSATSSDTTAILKLQQVIQEGSLGKINYVYSNRLNIGKIRTEENILWSFAPHDISVMLSLLNEMPSRVSCQEGAWLNRDVFELTLSHFEFPSGVQTHYIRDLAASRHIRNIW